MTMTYQPDAGASRAIVRTARLVLATGLLLGALGPVQAGEFDCLIEPRQLIEIRSSVQGLIEKVWVDRGELVKAGQVLVTLDAGLEKASAELAKFRAGMTSPIRSSESRVEFADLKFNRKDKLQQQNYISAQERDEAATERRLAQSELEEAKDNHRLAQLEYQRVKEQLRQRTLVSPVAGVVVERMMHPGELADTGDIRKPILKIADISVLYIEALLPNEVFRYVKVGDSAQILSELPDATPFPAVVRTVDRVLDAASGTFRVRLEVNNPKLAFPAGLKCTATFPGVGGGLRAAGNRGRGMRGTPRSPGGDTR